MFRASNRIPLLVIAVTSGAFLPACRRAPTPAQPVHRAVTTDEPPRVAAMRDKDKEVRGPSAATVASDATAAAAKKAATPEPHPLRRCFPGDTAGAAARPLDALLERAADQFDGGDFAAALACAEEAARVEPHSVKAHHDRGAALQALSRLDESLAAFARALALDPEEPDTLAGAADLFINHLPQSSDHTETGLEYARRGSRRVKRSHDKELIAWLAWLEGQALNDLGRPREALSRLDSAIAATPDNPRIRYERAVALFELCRFEESKKAFREVVDRSPKDAWAHHHLGLVLERLGDAGADREFERARGLAATDFPAPILLGVEEFRAAVKAEAAKLPADLRADLAQVTLETADLPESSDLTAEEPPLSPTILGLFRGAPLGDSSTTEARTIVLYRKNLGRAVTSSAELTQQIRTTLLHELGHLRGEDDEELRARGLE